jgi:hypothetical protein
MYGLRSTRTKLLDVILRSETTKNLLVTRSAEIPRGACPELAKGLRMTKRRFQVDTK